MSIKKCVNGSFVNDFYREYGTDTDTITSLPQTIIGDGQNISAWSMKGNMTQSGTPTPSNPVYPVETGEKTANLLNSDWIENGYGISNVNGLPTVASNRIATTTPIPIPTTATAISVSFSAANKIFMIYSIFRNGALIERKATQVSGATITTDNIDEMYICFYASDSSIVTKNDVSSIMVNVGAPLSYEPYGYKIPISFNGATYPIYLSEPIRKIGDSVDTAPSSGTASRFIKKFVLDGNTQITDSGTSGNYHRYSIRLDGCSNRGSEFSTDVITTHYRIQTGWGNGNAYLYSEFLFISLLDSEYPNSTSLKNFFSAQQAAGTPVTVWYQLATPTTEQFTAPTIPTSGSPQSFDVDTTLKPSEVSLTWHGWHEHEDTKFTT